MRTTLSFNHLKIYQDKSKKFGLSYSPWLPLLLSPPEQFIKVKRLKLISPSSKEYQAQNARLNSFLKSSHSDVEVVEEMKLMDASLILPKNEIIAQFITLLAKKKQVQSIPLSEQVLVESLYTKATSRSHFVSMHLKNSLLKYILLLPQKILPITKQLPSDILSTLSLSASTTQVIIPHTSIASLFKLISKLPIKTLHSPLVQMLILKKIATLEHDDKKLIMMRFIAYLSTRAKVSDEALVYTHHPLSVLVSKNPIVLDTCSAGALRHYWTQIKDDKEFNNQELVKLWKSGKRLGDEIVVNWCGDRLGLVKVFKLGRRRYDGLAEVQRRDCKDAIKGVEEGRDIDDALMVLDRI